MLRLYCVKNDLVTSLTGFIVFVKLEQWALMWFSHLTIELCQQRRKILTLVTPPVGQFAQRCGCYCL